MNSSDSSCDEEWIFGNSFQNRHVADDDKEAMEEQIEVVEAEGEVMDEDQVDAKEEHREAEVADEDVVADAAEVAVEAEVADEAQVADEAEVADEDDEDGDDTHLWLSSVGPPRVLTDEEERDRMIRAKKDRERQELEMEERIDDEKEFSRRDERIMIEYLVKWQKISIAHDISAWFFLSSTDSLTSRRSANRLQSYFLNVLRYKFALYTSSSKAIDAFIVLNRRIGLCKLCGR